MANCMSGADKVKDMYDLKGSADDKPKAQNGVKVPEVHKDNEECMLLLAQI